VIRATYSISPTLLNETAFNNNGNRINISPLGLYQRPSGLNIPELLTGNNPERIPSVSLGGSTGTNFDVASWPQEGSRPLRFDPAANQEVFPPEPPAAQWPRPPGRRTAGEGAPLSGAAQRILAGEHRSEAGTPFGEARAVSGALPE